ncbi:hypothetical protein HYPSUDRAFT_72507 [Hypholoma sublateritium FD-334 SS-4]|uniref:Phospholipase/carboxylesterase/thioesterase domain-containing protein n=1 Tax=Hypholoma sublateritium (strain FD-334 SS-4) TaxID=945553 RepID=A0A0D2P1R5_HYPSF|nr:hypothetical protein HYPSUDRAFT_72507 [Hypholoma sublateritium FD-334 SS-4]
MSDLHLRAEHSASPRVKQAPKLAGAFFYAPSDDGTDENLLVLLHGLGDTHAPFAKLGKSLKLPQTAVLALRAPAVVPFLYEDAWQWFPAFDGLGAPLITPDPTPAIDFLTVALAHLTGPCAWPPDRIHLFGFAQGGTAAAELAVSKWSKDHTALASVVSISGALLSYPTLSTVCPTPILIAHRPPPAESPLPPTALAVLKRTFGSVTESRMSAAREGMPVGRDEWEPIMRFWSQRLSRRREEGLYEVMTGAA